MNKNHMAIPSNATISAINRFCEQSFHGTHLATSIGICMMILTHLKFANKQDKKATKSKIKIVTPPAIK